QVHAAVIADRLDGQRMRRRKCGILRLVIACREGGAGGQQGSDSETLHNSLRENIAVAAASGSSTHKASVATSNSGGRVSDSATPAMPARLLTPADPARLNIR